MIYQLRDKKRINRKKIVIRNIVIVGLFLLISLSGALGFLGRIFNFIGRPIWKAENTIVDGVSSVSYLVRTKSSVFKENESLKKENADLKLSMIDYDTLKKDNDSLKELLGRLPQKENFTIANILAKPNRSPYDTIIVDIGKDFGILEGEKVFANGNTPIGEIGKVYTDNSLVILYSNPGQTTEAMIEGSNASVELVGRGGGNFEMTVPNELVTDNGFMVVLPGGKSEIVAIIDGIISRPTDPIKKVILHSPINIQSLKWVEIKRN